MGPSRDELPTQTPGTRAGWADSMEAAKAAA